MFLKLLVHKQIYLPHCHKQENYMPLDVTLTMLTVLWQYKSLNFHYKTVYSLLNSGFLSKRRQDNIEVAILAVS